MHIPKQGTSKAVTSYIEDHAANTGNFQLCELSYKMHTIIKRN